MSVSTKRALRAGTVSATAALLVLMLGPALAAAAGNTVNIEEHSDRYSFVPGSMQVAVGSTVTWKNGTDAQHTVTADDDSTNSGNINPTASYSQTFNTAGTWAYHCEIHAYMRGTITVLAAGQTPPATDTLRRAGTPTPSTPWLSIFAALAMVGLVGGWLVSKQLAKRRQGVEP